WPMRASRPFLRRAAESCSVPSARAVGSMSFRSWVEHRGWLQSKAGGRDSHLTARRLSTGWVRGVAPVSSAPCLQFFWLDSTEDLLASFARNLRGRGIQSGPLTDSKSCFWEGAPV